MIKFSGVMPALVSPLDANENINLPVLSQLLNDLLAKGADGFYLCGATGEGIAISPEQRMILAEEAIKTVKGRKPCIVQYIMNHFFHFQPSFSSAFLIFLGDDFCNPCKSRKNWKKLEI